jgi:thiol-disulfide isomerase/thioredoxin
MKKKLILSAGIALMLVGCNTKNPNEVTVSGTITNPINNTVEFFNKDTSFTTTTKEDGSFSLSFTLDSAAYFNFQHGPESTAMFIEPGNTIGLSINPEEFDESISYTGSLASNYLAKKYLTEEQTDFKGKLFYTGTNEAYKSMLNEYQAGLINTLDQVPNQAFVTEGKENLKEDLAYYLGKQQKIAELGPVIANYLMQKEVVNAQFEFYYALDTMDTEGFESMLTNFANQTNALLAVVTNEEFKTTEIEKTEKTVKSWSERKVLKNNVPAIGEPAKDFTYQDITGNDVSLASLKGKLVYVDVWATWCGPCKAEIPALQALEAEYHDKNIQFLSVSVDIDKAAWEAMVTEKELGGIQLWADGWSEITKDYAIFGIPRFMLFDEAGNVVSTDAVRPSSDEIRDLLNSNL